MKSFFSRIATIVVLGLLMALTVSSGRFALPALANEAQQPKLSKEEKKRLQEEEKKKKEEEKRVKKQEELRKKEEEKKQKEAAKNGKGNTNTPSSRADGMDISILMNDGKGAFAPVNASREFKNGDQFRVEYTSKLNGIVYFINIDPAGKTGVIYRERVSAGNKYVHPAPEDKKIIQVGGLPGVEVLKIVMSPKEIPELENAYKSGGKLGDTPQKVKDELVGYVVPEPAQACGGLELAGGGVKVKCRELTVVSSNVDQGKISVALAATGNSSPGAFNLNSGEVAVLEIRLKHVQ